MEWIMNAIANVILEALNDILLFTVNLVTDFNLEVWSAESSFGEKFGTAISGFQNAILILGMFIVIMSSILKLYQAMGGPFTQSEEPGVILIRTIFAGCGTILAYRIFAIITNAFNEIYKRFVEVYTGLAAQYTSGSWMPRNRETENLDNALHNATPSNPRVDFDHTPGSVTDAMSNVNDDGVFNFFGGDSLIQSVDDPSLGLLILEAIIGCTLIICFFKLVFETYERYVIIGIMYFTAPLAFSTLVSKSSAVFKNWVQMLVCQFILMCTNLVFLGVFVGAWFKILENAQSNSYVFTNEKEYLTTMFLMIGWLLGGQKMDEHLRALGLSAATTGSGIMGAMMGGAALAGGAFRAVGGIAGSASRGIGNAATGQTKFQRAVREGQEGRGGGLVGEVFGHNRQNKAANDARAAEDKAERANYQEMMAAGMETVSGAVAGANGTANSISNTDSAESKASEIKRGSTEPHSSAPSSTPANGQNDASVGNGNIYKPPNKTVSSKTEGTTVSGNGKSGSQNANVYTNQTGGHNDGAYIAQELRNPQAPKGIDRKRGKSEKTITGEKGKKR